jgi:hypothetical protein
MIIYGSRAKQVGHEHLTDKCPNCESQNTLDLFVFQRYAHVFWIPFVPIGKTGVSQCGNCKQVLKLNQMPAYLKAAYQRAQAQTKTPIWMFLGLAAVVVLIGVAVLDGKKKDAKNAQLILSPQAGDVMEYKTKTGSYTLLKVESVTADSVFMRENNYETDKESGIYQLKSKEYALEVESISKKDLKALFDKGNILDIDRK